MVTANAPTKRQKVDGYYEALRAEIFEDANVDDLWNRKKSSGFTTIPRTLPLIHQIMDNLSVGKPVSGTYFALWSRVHDQGLIVLDNVHEVASESGFYGERAISTWKVRMKKLVELGFIRAESGTSGEFNYVLLINPYKVIAERYKDKPSKDLYRALFSRANQIGATDIDRFSPLKM